MQKVLDLLERYVEWVALAIGGLFLLLMVFLYLFGTPISAQAGNRTVTLANVESHTWNGPGTQLANAMNHNNVPSVEVASYVDGFKQHMQKVGGEKPAAPQSVWFAATGAPATPLKHEETSDQGATAQLKEGSIPQNLPAPKYYGFSTGKSNVQTDPAKGAGMPMGGPPPEVMGGYGGAPGGYPPGAYGGPPPWVLEQMGAAPPGAAPAPSSAGTSTPAAAKSPGGTDKVWVTLAYTVTADDIAAAFEEANVPSNLATVFLRLDPIRQELLPDGTWGNDTRIEPLAYHNVPEFPKANVVDERVYADWASRNAMTLLAPNFYPRLAGDTWYAPGQPDPNKVVEVRPVVQPGQYPGQIPGQGQNPRLRRGGNVPPDVGGMPPGTGRRGRMRYAPQDDQRPSLPFRQYMPPGAVEAMRAAQEAGAAGAYGPPGYGGSGFARPAASVPEGYKVPSGTFNPAELDADIFVWFHDDTVEPGKTYRYKMSYRIRNPLHGMDRVAKSPEAARVFAIASAESDWSEAITVSPITQFFVASGISTGSTTVRFDVFKWQEGTWHKKQFTTSPGDMIGLVDDKIDYRTGWTLADLNTNAVSRKPVVLADPRGNLSTRDFQGDQGNANRFEKEIGYKDPNAPVRQTPGMVGPDGMPYGNPPPDFMPPGGPYGPYGR